VKTSLAPGSRVVTDYLDKAGLSTPLADLGFQTVGYGCTTCIGNSGPLPQPVASAVEAGNLVVSAVLSGNRNFEGRVNAHVKANYLASPPLVVAYALAGGTDVDLVNEPIGQDRAGRDVFLRDIWPTADEVSQAMGDAIDANMFADQYAHAFDSNEEWNAIDVAAGDLYTWDEASTYIQEPPFLVDLNAEPAPIESIAGARVLLLLGDSVTTDHISPAGSIAKDGPAGRYLVDAGVEPVDFNSYGSRRGNDRVMHRGTFANIRIRNQLAPGTEGGWTRVLPGGEVTSVYEASQQYREAGVPLVVLAGIGIRHGQQSRLGCERNVPARRESRHRRQLRTDSPQQPCWHGRVAPGIRRRPNLAIVRADG
jgi:aconitate hydratase